MQINNKINKKLMNHFFWTLVKNLLIQKPNNNNYNNNKT